MLLAALPLTTVADQATQARALASQMIQQLGATLKQELAANGPDGAVSVCRDMAPTIAGNCPENPVAGLRASASKPATLCWASPTPGSSKYWPNSTAGRPPERKSSPWNFPGRPMSRAGVTSAT